jgi:molecular chaperone HscA
MVLPLAKGDIKVKGIDIPVASAPSFPKWLQEIDANLEADYPRVAVSLGGARKQIIQRGNAAHITAGDVTGTPVLGGYYTKGN